MRRGYADRKIQSNLHNASMSFPDSKCKNLKSAKGDPTSGATSVAGQVSSPFLKA
jgi:hypothetical protein